MSEAEARPIPSAFLAVGGKARALTWLALLTLTAVVVVYPTRPGLVFGPVESVDIIVNLPLFAAAYHLWLFALLVLLLSQAGPSRDHWEKTFLVAIFALVFWGFWVVGAPEGKSEELGFLAHARFVGSTGRVGLHEPNLVYFGFPAIAILAHAVSGTTSLTYLASRTTLLLFNGVLVAVTLYRVYEPIGQPAGKSGHHYLVGVPLVVQGSMSLASGYLFRPEAALAHPLLVVLVLLLRSQNDERHFFTRQGLPMALIIFAALAVTHLYTSLAVVAVLGGAYAVRATSRLRPVGFSVVVLFVLAIVAWQVYYATPVFERVVTYVNRVIDLFLQGKGFFYARTLLAANAGAGVPLWASATRVFWVIAIYVFGGLLAVVNLRRLRQVTRDERIWTGAVMAVAVLTVLIALFTGTGDQLARYLQWGSFFAVPLILLYLSRALSPRWALGVVLVPFFLLSFSSFLAFNGNESVRRFYPQERRAAELLTSFYSDRAASLSLFSGLRSRSYYVYYLPQANFHSSVDAVLAGDDVSVVWKDVGDLATRFVNRDSGLDPPAAFVFDEAFRLTYYHLLGISPQDAGWLSVRARLATTNAFYDSGMVQLFVPRAGGHKP